MTRTLQDDDHENDLMPPPMFELTIVMPCLNEASTVGACIDEALGYLERSGVVGEVVVADNGSTDSSVEIAASHGARVVHVEQAGYGWALRAGMENALGTWVIMADSDMSYDFGHLDGFVEALRNGADLVVGNRFAGGIQPGAMPALHRYLGNPVLSFVARRLFSLPVRDFHCGLRAVRRDTAGALPYRSTGMEFASEMIVRCSFADMEIAEVPTILRPDGRNRAPHLRRWRDGWRHLRLLLLYSPRWLFVYPGLAAILVSLIFSWLAIVSNSDESGVRFGMTGIGFFGVGIQAVSFGVLSKVWGARLGLLPGDVRVTRFVRRFPTGLALGAALAIGTIGLALLAAGLDRNGIDALDILGVGVFVISVQIALNGALLGISTL